MEYIELTENDLKNIKYVEQVTHTKYLEDDYAILDEDLLGALNNLVSYYKELKDDYRKLEDEINGE